MHNFGADSVLSTCERCVANGYEKEGEKEIINAWYIYIFNSLDQEHLIYFLLLRFSADHKKSQT